MWIEKEIIIIERNEKNNGKKEKYNWKKKKIKEIKSQSRIKFKYNWNNSFQCVIGSTVIHKLRDSRTDFK